MQPRPLQPRRSRRASTTTHLVLVAVLAVLALIAPSPVAANEDGVGDGPIVGTDGRLLRVSVEVEPGLELVGPPAADVVFDILSDGRSWIGAGDVRFQIVDGSENVSTADVDIRVRIAPPAVVDQRCRPLRTGGQLSCRNGRSLNLNADRWNGATSFWSAGLDVYRAYLINHEVGHYLGYGHRNCPGAGQPAPVMQQQTKSLQGCVENGWPYPDNEARTIVAPGLSGTDRQPFRLAADQRDTVERIVAMLTAAVRSVGPTGLTD